ncbi:TrbM/KikA/MpfK family conjugal transfer protein [Xenorhabdus bovienii]|uniref:TrbM family protein n=1 Tax=Xenorhabdus bovienii str. kraussei Becker Underwood TaxID=1398204 RepID=A0A077PT12_XENBV|nr:TrbM/KikA/MpfK family conjugal transfer protein [Xenorhabdus bovienii]CDH24128.1 TrbM family protein [Xenorhabdus bovienii str. kraussei Becker Underwood]
MKKLIISALICIVLPLQAAYADDNLGDIVSEPVNNSDPCTVVLCMYGKATDNSSSECSGAERKFFSIIKKKHGAFNPSRTFNARQSFLNGCPAATADVISKIMSKYGRTRW